MVYKFNEESRNEFNPDRVPPQNVEAEEAVLGGCLFDHNAITRIIEILRPEAFYLKAHEEIYRAMTSLALDSLPTDLMNVSSWLRDREKLEKIGGPAKLVALVDRTVSAANIDQYAALIREKFMQRELIRVGTEIQEIGFESSEKSETLIDRAEQAFYALSSGNTSRSMYSAADLMASTQEEIESRSLGLVLPGISCGFYDLDAMTQGFQRGDLVIVAGRPAMGKTSFVLNLARNIAAFHKLPIAVFSLEMGKEQLIQRMLSSEVRIETGRLRAGRIAQSEWEPLGHAISQLSALPLFIDDTPAISVSEIRSKARRLQAEQGGALGMIVIDYLQLMNIPGSDDNRAVGLSKVTRMLKGLARELKVPVVALSQLSRAVESRTNKRPMMSDLRESGGIEQDADLIMMLYRDEYYNPDSPDRGIAEVIISKHRNGPVGTVKVLFEPQFTQFRNLATPNKKY